MTIHLIVFNSERLHELPCSYNFNWVHCEGKTEEDECFEEYCFCNATFTHGVQLFHGNSGTFTDTDSLPFAHNVYIQFNQVSHLFADKHNRSLCKTDHVASSFVYYKIHQLTCFVI